MKVLILGCGYLGLPLGRELVGAGHQVFGVRRQAEGTSDLQSAGIVPLAADLTRAGDLQRLGGPYDWIVNCVSSSRGGAEVYRRVFLDGARQLLAWLAPQPPRKYVWTSSTSVYGQTDGGWVTEASPVSPATATGQVLMETENLLRTAWQRDGFPAIILRLSGLYGPGRGHLFQQFLRGEARLHGEGGRYLNMVHLDDAVSALRAALERGLPGETYNVTDGEPVTERAFFSWLAEALERPLPPEAPESALAGRKRGLTSKRVSNRRLTEELRVGLRYPDYRAGYAAEIQRWRETGHQGRDFCKT